MKMEYFHNSYFIFSEKTGIFFKNKSLNIMEKIKELLKLTATNTLVLTKSTSSFKNFESLILGITIDIINESNR